MFADTDLQKFKQKNIDLRKIDDQIAHFKTGFPFMPIVKPATVGDGILQLDKAKCDSFISRYDQSTKNKTILKFVPASGAASRMFKHLFDFLNKLKEGADHKQLLANDKGFNSVHHFFEHLSDFAFYDDLNKHLPGIAGKKAVEMTVDELIEIIEIYLTETGMNYGNQPKGLLKFHRYNNVLRTAFEEHLMEGALYASSGGNSNIHFTVSPEHRHGFEKLYHSIKESYEKHFGVTYHIGFSEQKSSTDTIAVELDNTPFREKDGTIVFRPGGHGALIENLNDLDSDIIFIKNIDNVVPERLAHETVFWKKIIAGVLLHYQSKIFNYIYQLNSSSDFSDNLLTEIVTFLEKELCVLQPSDFNHLSKPAKKTYINNKLNRPIRVCGMVKNEGEPGGGPYWALDAGKSVSLQIVESSQIDTKNPEMKAMMNQATHFNPVDLVCGTKDYKGNKFDLLQFVDPQTGFISSKSKDGRELKAQELPGLWNGAMSDWNTIFVEVPVITFNPVKIVNDLLREQHR